jgi:outer membrane protein insertion porin family
MSGIRILSKRLLLLQAALMLTAGGGIQTTLAQEAPDAVANAPAARKIVKQIVIQYRGAATIDEARVRAQMATREGEAFTNESIEQDIRNLYATGSVENVDIKSEDVAGGVRVVVTIAGRGAVGEISFLGNSMFDNRRLAKEIEVKVGDPVDDSKLSAAQQKILELYQKRGFSDVTVSYSTEPAAQGGFTRVVFNVTEGSRGVVHDIRFEGNTQIKDSKLRSKLKTKEKKIWHLWGKAGKINNDDLQEDIKTVERAFQDEGYVYAKVTEVRREPVGEDKLDLVFVISEGEKYDVAGVNVEGNTVFTLDELLPGIVTEAGFPYSGSDVRADEKMIGDYYGSRGYADARVDTSIIPAGPGKVSVLYRITEGTKSLIRKVNIGGNTVTKDNVIRRELPFTPGEEMNTVKMEAGKKRLENLNYFSAVDMRNTETGQESFKDVDVTVAEQSTGAINFGAGFSSIDSLVGFLDLTQTNFDLFDWPSFRGGGQRFYMGIKYGTKRRDFQLNFTEPWFLGQKLSFGVELFYRDLFYLSDVYDQTNWGGGFTFRKPLGEHSYAEFGYTLQNIEIAVDEDENVSEIIQSEEGDFLQSKIDLTYVHDTRDNVFLPRSGHKVEVGALMSGSFLGGDADVYGFSVSGQQYFNLPWDTILSFEGSISTVDSWGSGDGVPIFERKFLGGANNLRGFDYRDVGPKDEFGEPIGGQTAAFFTAEYTFPIMEKVRGAVFYDLGAVSTDAYDIGGEVNSNVGIGLRLYLPIGPVRVDFGIPVQSDEFNDSGGKFNFNLGYKF